MNRQQLRSEETRSRILVAAETSFATGGYEATSVDAICHAAGLSKGAFYHHFASKEALFLELLNRWLVGMDAQLGLLRAETTDVPDRLMAMTGLIGEVLQAATDRVPIYLEFWSRALRDPLIFQATLAPFRRYQEFFAEMLAAGVAAGTLKSVNSDTGSKVIVALALGLLIQGLLDRNGSDWEEITQEGIRLLMAGLTKE